MSVPTPLDTLMSGLVSICRLPKGVTVLETQQQEPSIQLKRLYDVESNLACKNVRERITELDLVVELVVPAAKNSRAILSSDDDDDYEYKLDKPTIPQLLVVTENGEDRWLVGDQEIITYLNSKFPTIVDTTTSKSDNKELEWLFDAGGYLSTILRWGRGVEICSAASAQRTDVPRPKKPLVLYSYEGNQFCRLVREILTELDIPYQLRSAGKGSPRRAELAKLTGGSTICPYLVDPNTNIQMAESADIIRYLYKTYALWTPPSELLQFASNSIVPLIGPAFKALAPLQAQWSSTDETKLEEDLELAMTHVEKEIEQNPIVVYTYQLSPFSWETKALLQNLGIEFKEISLGLEWFPGFLAEPHKRAALLKLTGQSSLPHVFIGGKSIGGLFSGTPGLVPALEQGRLQEFFKSATTNEKSSTKTSGPAPTPESLGSFE